jgi:hypothetical protein
VRIFAERFIEFRDKSAAAGPILGVLAWDGGQQQQFGHRAWHQRPDAD